MPTSEWFERNLRFRREIAADSIESLEMHVVWKALFVDAFKDPPDGSIHPSIDQWNLWTRPQPAILADEAISRLIEKTGNPRARVKMRARSHLQAEWRRPFCPYYEVRIAIGTAVDRANKAEQQAIEGRKTMKPRLGELSKGASKIVADIDRFRKRWYSKNLKDKLFFDERDPILPFFQEHKEEFERIDELFNAFARIAKEAHDSRSYFARNGTPVGVWRQAFVVELGRWFHFMTGAKPSKGPAFREFVDAAYLSVDGERDLEAAVRTVVTKAASNPAEWTLEIPINECHRAGKFRDLPPLADTKPALTLYQFALSTLKVAAEGALHSDERYLFGFCEILALHPDRSRLEKDLVIVLPRLKKLSRWTEAEAKAMQVSSRIVNEIYPATFHPGRKPK